MAKNKGPSIDLINEAMQSQKVRSALSAKAARVLPRARAIALSVGATEFARALEVADGTRPGTQSPTGLKRAYARVGATVTEEMKVADGRTQLNRTQILRRAKDG